MTQENSEDNSISFLDRVACILQALSSGKYTVKDIAQSCKLNNSTTHRLLNLLDKPGFTLYDRQNHRYYIGPLINQLVSNPSTAHQFLLLSSEEELKQLSDYTGETINLSCLFSLRIEPLYEIPSKYGLKVLISEDVTNRQTMVPLAASQKILLSELPPNRLRQVLESIKIISDPLLDVDEIIEDLDQVRNKGFCISYGTLVPGAIAIAAPILGYTCPLALTIVGPETRIKNKVSTYTTQLIQTTHQLEKKINKFFQIGGPI